MDDIVKQIIKKIDELELSPTSTVSSSCSSFSKYNLPMTPPEYQKKYTPPHQRKNNKKNVKEEKHDNKQEQRKARFATTTNNLEYGFVSRGEDNRLQQSADDRQRYFISIIRQFIRFHSQTQIGDIHSLVNEGDIQSANTMVEPETTTTNITMDSILLSVRKLREALLYSKPTPFHKKVFLFSLRLAAIMGHYQTYIPSINYLLHHNKTQLELTTDEIEEIATLLILHLVHFNQDLSRAIDVYFKYVPSNKPLFDIIQAWIHHDFVKWFHLMSIQGDPYKLAIMKLGKDKMIKWLIASIGVSMYRVDKKWLEMEICSGEINVENLLTKFGSTWRVEEDGMVVIRERVK
ncbi:hypothetical protein JA1_005407 [Spathaspora sp. JA1]|nr:hypothetical protein JA1_005407 [Spathaspora sp. JA1]